MNTICNGYGASVGKVTPNRDAFFCNPKKGIFGVFDGVGSNYNSEKASAEAARLFSNAAVDLGSLDRYDKFVGPWLSDLMGTTNGQIKFGVSAETTATVMVICANTDNPTVCIANIGDSRIYGFNNKTRTINRLTVDDSNVKIYPKFDHVQFDSELTDTELAIFKNCRNIINNAIGGINYEPTEIVSHSLEEFDSFLLTTDGIHDNLTTKEIGTIILTSESEEEVVKTLIESARNRSQRLDHLRSKPDDMTAVYVTLGLER